MRRRTLIAGGAVAVALLLSTTIQAQRVGGPGGRQGGIGQGGPGPNGPVPNGPAVAGPNSPDVRPGPGRPGPAGDFVPMLGGGLDLTNDQQDKIRDLTRAARDQAASVADELELARKQLRREVFADARNAGKISELTTKIVAFEKQLLDIRVKSEVSVADVLTAEQRQTVRAGSPRVAGRGRVGGGPTQGGPRPGRG